jgi:PAS domain S-box-containing protein
MAARKKASRKSRATKRPVKRALDLKQENAALKHELAQALDRAAAMQRRQERAEKGLLESERSFRLLVQGITDYAIYMLDRTGRVANWNVGAQRIKGYSADEIVGQHFSKFYTPEDIAAGLPEKGLITAAREGRYEAEGWRLRKDGTRFWAAVVIDVIKDDNGRLIGFAKIARDITERKQAEEILRRNEAAYLAEAQQLSQTGSFGLNMDTREVFWSDETFRIFGYDPNDPTTKPSLELARNRVHPHDWPRVRELVGQVINNRQELEFEHRLLMPDGTVKTVHVRARALKEKITGQPDTPTQQHFVVSVMDVTARTEAYAALERSERRYRYLFDHMPVALIQIRLHGRVSGRQIIEQLRSEGVIDLLGYLDQHPEYVRDLLDGATIESVNEQAIRMFGARDASELIAMPYARLWRERPDTFRRILESRFQVSGRIKRRLESWLSTDARSTSSSRSRAPSGSIAMPDLFTHSSTSRRVPGRGRSCRIFRRNSRMPRGSRCSAN